MLNFENQHNILVQLILKINIYIVSPSSKFFNDFAKYYNC